MSKSKILLTAVLLSLILIPSYIFWRDARAFNNFTQYFERVSMVMDDGAEKNKVAPDQNYGQGVESLNAELAERLERIYKSYAGSGDANIDTAITLTRGLFDELFRLRAEFATTVEPFLSGRMRDKKTLKDKTSHEWRRGVLEGVDQYMSAQRTHNEKIMEDFRQAVSASNLPEKYKKFIWQDWGRDLNSRLSGLGPDVEHFQSEVMDYRRLFDYLYEYSDVYYVSEEGRIVIANNRHLKEYQSIAKSVSQEWW